jgi:hypothetical protein
LPDKFDEKDVLNNKLRAQHKLNDEQIKIFNRIEVSGNKNYAKYNEEIFEPYVKGVSRD